MFQKFYLFGLVIFMAIFFQSAFMLIETIESPNEIVVSFCKAYYQLDDSARDYVSNQCHVQNDIDLIDQYFYTQKQKANECGYRDKFLVNYLTKIHTEILDKTHNSAVVKIKAKRLAIIPWLRTRKTYDVDHTFTLSKKKNQWLISDGITNM